MASSQDGVRARESLSGQLCFLPVRLAEHYERQLLLVVVKRFGQEPLMLLTTKPLRRKGSVVWWIVQAYIARWRIEETIRFIKDSYELNEKRQPIWVLPYDDSLASHSYCLSGNPPDREPHT